MFFLYILYDIIKGLVIALRDLIFWIYLTLIPFLVMYFGVPLFILGLLMGVAFSGGTFIILLIFFVALFYFIKNSVFHNPF
jgi:hypothetical protein